MQVVPESTEEYSKPEYWEERFEQEEAHEWFASYDAFRHLLLPHIAMTARILIVGNGTSNLPWDLAREGYGSVTATDVCSNLISKLKQKKGIVVVEVADMFSLPYGAASFDVVIEKGTLDVLFTDSKSPWDPPPSVCLKMETSCREIHRVLTPDGTLFSISFTQPRFRSHFFAECDWSCVVESFGEKGSLEYFVYRLEKGSVAVERTLNAKATVSQWKSTSDPMHDYMDESSFLFRIDI